MRRGSGARGRPLSGIVLVDKPQGSSSNRVLQQIRRLFRAQKAGHTGTLDPLATGMLPICLGHATRVSGLMLDASKRYRVTALFGIATDTGDAEGRVVDRRDVAPIDREALAGALDRFRGRIEQVPPMYSALKQGGRRLYALARQGIEVPREPRAVEIHELEVDALAWPRLSLQLHCSKGTYVRSLVTELAAALATVAHVESLRRLAVGPFAEADMVTLATLEQAAAAGDEALDRHLLPADAALPDRPAVSVSGADARALRQGRRVGLVDAGPGPLIRVYDEQGTFIGIGEIDGSGMLKPRRIFPESALG